MANGPQNITNMYDLLDTLTTVVELQSRESATVQQLAIQLGERILATQQNATANIVQLGRVREDFVRINASANDHQTQVDQTFQRARQLVAEVNTLLDGPSPAPGSPVPPVPGESPPPAPAPVPPQPPVVPPPITWQIPCPYCVVEMTLTIERVVTNNNTVEYVCPFRLSSRTCQTGKRLGPSWKNHIKITCLPKLTSCPGLPKCPGRNPQQ